MARTHDYDGLECLCATCEACKFWNADKEECNPVSDDPEVIKTIVQDGEIGYITEMADTGHVVMYWLSDDPEDTTKYWCVGTLENGEITSTEVGEDRTRECTEELYHDRLWATFSRKFKKTIMDNLEKVVD